MKDMMLLAATMFVSGTITFLVLEIKLTLASLKG